MKQETMGWQWHQLDHTHNTHTTVLLLFWNMSGTTCVSRYQKGKTRQVKTNLDLLEQETVSGSGIYWAICKVCTSSQTTMPTSHHSLLTGRMPFLPPNQQRQSTNWTTVGLCKPYAPHSRQIINQSINQSNFYFRQQSP